MEMTFCCFKLIRLIEIINEFSYVKSFIIRIVSFHCLASTVGYAANTTFVVFFVIIISSLGGPLRCCSIQKSVIVSLLRVSSNSIKQVNLNEIRIHLLTMLWVLSDFFCEIMWKIITFFEENFLTCYIQKFFLFKYNCHQKRNTWKQKVCSDYLEWRLFTANENTTLTTICDITWLSDCRTQLWTISF